MLIVLTGKTASGKDTIKTALLSRFPNLKKVITTTSRTPRNNEVLGVDYNFLSREEFLKKIKSNDFAEWVEYGGNLYGTYKSELEEALKSDVLWKIDPSRAGEVRNFLKRAFDKQFDVKVIYINTPDEVILERLRRRNLSDLEIQKRMEDDKKIWEENKENYDFVVENIPNQLDQVVEKVTSIISSPTQL